jgi:hypothetical protein
MAQAIEDQQVPPAFFGLSASPTPKLHTAAQII